MKQVIALLASVVAFSAFAQPAKNFPEVKPAVTAPAAKKEVTAQPAPHKSESKKADKKVAPAAEVKPATSTVK